MSSLSHNNTPIINRYSFPLFLLLLLAGLAGNYCKFFVFLNIDLLFGSIFAMLILQFFGPGRAIPAAAVIAGYTYILWNSPSAIFIMTAEVAIVSWLMWRRKTGMVLADTLYWLIIGMPLSYLFLHFVMDLPVSNTSIIVIKQAVNGIANALVARLIFTAYAIRSRALLISHSELVYNLLAFFVLCPALIMLVVESRTDFAITDNRIRTELIQDSKSLSLRLETWVGNRKSAILNLAEMAASRSPQQMQSSLEQAKRSDVNFLRTGLMNKAATSTVVFPEIDENGNVSFGKNYGDRPYLPTLKRELKPMLSEVVIDRVGVPNPVVMMLAPVLNRGEYSGYVAGIVSLDQIRAHFNSSMDEKTSLYTLLDKNGNVIMTNRPDQAVMMPFVRGKGTLNRLDNGISQWMPQLRPDTIPALRWQKSLYVTETAIGDQSEWKLILEQPVAPFQKALYDNYTGRLTLLFLVLLGSLALAELLSRKIVVSMEKLSRLTNALPDRLGTDCEAIVWPESGIKETTQLVDNFRAMADSLTEKFHEIKQLNESLEQRVDKRTCELQQSRDEWAQTFDSIPDIITVLDSNHNILHANRAMLDTFAATAGGEQLGKPCYQVVHGLEAPPECCPHSLLLRDGLEHRKEMFEPQLNKHFLVTATPVYNPEGKLTGSIHVSRDISDRVKMEEELAALVQEVEARNRFVESVITNLQSGIIVVDPDFRIKMVNSYVVGLCGISAEQFTDINLADVSRELYEKVMAGKTADELLASFFSIQKTIGYNYVDLTDSEGSVAGYIITFKDLTEIVRIRKELRQKERLSAMGEVVARVAHEMRNPLFGMTAAAQILEMELTLEASQQELMDSLLKESRRLNNLVEELLDTTRETRINKKRVNLLRVIDESVQIVEAMLNKQRVSIYRRYEGEVWVSADLEKLEQVIINLVKNASEASGFGDCINLEVECGGSHVSVIVSDNGEGILLENLERIFDVFFTTKKNGTGMGLSICRGIVEAHGGSLTASNNPDRGARFIMQLPLEECQA